MTELLRVRYRDIQAPWTTHDYHDMRFLSTALAYCDTVCPDRRWGELALRSDHIANSGVIISTGRDAVPQAIERLFGSL
jgi:hypothetical protein